MNQDKKIHLEAKIMKKIKNEKIGFRSKYIFLARKLGLGGGLTLSLILAILFLNLTFFTLKASGNLEFLSFGKIGISVFLESFPYHWLLIGLIFFIITSIILSRYDISYKKPFKKLLSLLFLLIFAVSVVLTISGINEIVEEKVVQGKIPLMRPFYGKMKGIWKNGLVGEIIEIQSHRLLVETREKKKVFIELTEDNLSLLVESNFKVGDRIRAVGEWDGERFHAYALRLTNKGKRIIMEPKRGSSKTSLK